MDSGQIGQVRSFNRTVTRRIGVLEDSYLQRGRPLGEARLLFEVGTKGADIQRLRDGLGLDSGYLSRLLRSLEAQGLLRVEQQADDRRKRHARLTAKGRAEFAAYDRLSDKLADSILGALDTKQRERLTGAMADVERLLRAASVTIAIEAPNGDDARWCLREYFRELSERFETGYDPAKANPVPDEEVTRPAGCFLIARLDGEPVGCAGLKRVDRTTAEIKRMWTAPAARGLGIARRMLRRLEEIAREDGFSVVRLDTNGALTEAQALYRAESFEEVAPFNDDPYPDHWFAKKL